MTLPKTANRTRAEHLGPERRRPQVLDTALEIAAEEGVANVTMAAVAERMEVTRPVVYACYPGRGELLAALLDRENQWALTNMLTMLPPRRTGSIEQMFVDGFRALLAAVCERPASWQIMVAADPDPVLSGAIARGRAQIADRVATVMRPLLDRWRVDDIDRVLPVLTEVFLAICETAARTMLDAQQKWTPDGLAEIVGRAAYRALRATSRH
ncbi:TetR/AcrR family transcriptional regulator [Mycobacterium sp.]|uniref:TetR/AcrR family transcriptional regulator n=1 Tax=Mycobacterium sp. TaxID=1785 RepID=UPI003D6B9A79